MHIDIIFYLWYNKTVNDDALVSSQFYYYFYDANGNITEIKDYLEQTLLRYKYDDLGQLIREDNKALNKTFVYEYDDAGNLINRYECTFTTSDTLPTMSNTHWFEYTDSRWGDLMTGESGNSTFSLSYDKLGNLTERHYSSGDLGEYYKYTWQGRQLTSASFYTEEYATGEKDVYFLAEYTYNSNGIRTSKTVDGVRHDYILNGSQILGETWTVNGVEYLLVYVYDANGSPVGLKYRTSNFSEGVYYVYFFEKNLFGDIIAIYDDSSNLIGKYTYDAWGNVTVSGTNSILNLNPFRYRGYYYDTETEFYYLQSRYYNPEWGRFISADSVEYLGANEDFYAYNIYAYCSNNPVMGYDPTGRWTFSISYGFSAFLMAGLTYSISIAFDSSGNIAIQTAEANVFDQNSGATFGAMSAGVSKNYSITSLDTVDDLNGQALNTGGSIPVYGPVSLEVEGISTTEFEPIGVSGGVSVGVGVDVHATASITTTHTQFNIFEGVKNIFDGIASWFGWGN